LNGLGLVDSVMETAKRIIKKALPIKCLEAVIVGTLLTRDIMQVTRFPLRFKSKYVYLHRTLALSVPSSFEGILSRLKLLSETKLLIIPV